MSFPEDSVPPVIRITKEDAMSSHVEDLLKRQASLRGERGIAARRGRTWYYSNWFVFAIAGILGALVALAAVEPFFDDFLYFGGTVQDVEMMDEDLGMLPVGDGQAVLLHADARALGLMRINGETLWLTSFTRVLDSGEVRPFDVDAIQAGDEVGVYVEYFTDGQLNAALAAFIERPAQRSHLLTASLQQLHARQAAVSLMLFPSVAALVGLFIGAIDGAICRLWWRMLVGGVVGLLVGFLGGFVSQFVAGLVYLPLNQLAMEQQTGAMGHLTTIGFFTQVTGRGLAWCLAGMAMGLGQGISLRSGRLLLYGFLGGAIGGLLGGVLFDPVDLVLVGPERPSAHLSRLVGMPIIGAGVGVMIGIVELLARDAWLRMVQGPLAGKEFLAFSIC